MSENSTAESDSQKIYTSMARMYNNAKSPRISYGDILQLTNYILDSGSNCHMIPDISYFIPGSLVEKDKYIKVSYRHFITAKQSGRVQIEMCNNNGKPFIPEL